MNITNSNKITIGFNANKISYNTAKPIEERINKASVVDIYCHKSPDDDTLSSAQPLARWLKSKHKTARVIADGDLKGSYISEDITVTSPEMLGTKGDLAIIVDFNDLSRASTATAKLLEQYKPENIVGFDHHTTNENPVKSSPNAPIYIDTTAKSCSSIIFRFFESLKIKLDNESLLNLFCGMSDDFKKSGLVDISSTKINKTPKMLEHPTSKEIFEQIENALPEGDRNKIIKNFNILENLNIKEKAFQNKLFTEKIQFSPSKKLAYIIIEPKNKEWIDLGQDNKVTSRILGDFRRRILANNPDDSLISPQIKNKLNNVQAVITFYRGSKQLNPADDVYQMSLLSKDNSATKITEEAKRLGNKEINGGGHPNRCGASISSTNELKCTHFVKCFIDAAEEIL